MITNRKFVFLLLYKYPGHINLVFLEQICPGLNLVADCVKFLVREKRLLSDAMDFKIIHKNVNKTDASFTRTVNITVFVSGTFLIFFDRHFDGQNGCATDFAPKSVSQH